MPPSCSRRRWPQYAQAHPRLPMLVDFVDVDSAKWAEYAPRHRWPLSWLYRREGARLLACERAVAARAQRSLLRHREGGRAVPPARARMRRPRRGHVQRCRRRLLRARHDARLAVRAPAKSRWSSPAPWTTGPTSTPSPGSPPRCCRGCARQRPQLRFHIVGRSPPPAVRALAGDAGVVVTGTVPDVRPYLQHAAVVVAPLRLARGIQNKILEAMAMGRPGGGRRAPVSKPSRPSPARETPGRRHRRRLPAQHRRLLRPTDRAAAIGACAAGVRVQQSYSWDAHLGRDRPSPGARCAQPSRTAGGRSRSC